MKNVIPIVVFVMFCVVLFMGGQLGTLIGHAVVKALK